MAAIHRGFSTHEKPSTATFPGGTFLLNWKRRYPDLNVICDPSHICSNRELLRGVTDRPRHRFDGIHLESHINPDKALSDAKQQVTPESVW